jgi:hypothetical protein
MLTQRSKLLNILILQCQPLRLKVQLKNSETGDPILLSPYTFISQIRKDPGLNSALIATAICTIDQSDPTILNIDFNDTANIKPNAKREDIPETNFESEPLGKLAYYWSLRAFVGTSPAGRPLEGSVLVIPETSGVQN